MTACGSEYYLRLIEVYGQQVGRPGGDEALRRIEPEIKNIEEAIGACLDVNQYTGVGVRQGFCSFMRFSGLGDTRLLGRMADAAQASGDAAEAAQCLLSLGRTSSRRSEYSAGAHILDAAQDAFQSLGDICGTAECRLLLAVLAQMGEDNSKASALIDNARRLYTTVEDTEGIGRCDCAEARVAISDKRIDDAAASVARALQTASDIGDARLLGEALVLSAEVAIKTGQTDDAEAANRQALDIYRDIGDVFGRAACTLQMSTIADKTGDSDVSHQNLLDAHALYSRTLHIRGQAICLKRLGDAEKAMSRFAEAALHYDEAIRLLSEGDPGSLLPAYVTSSGSCYLASRDLAKAQDRYVRALELYTDKRSEANRAMCTKMLASIADKLGDREKSRSLYREAIGMNAALGCAFEEACCWKGLAAFEAASGDKTLAITQYRLAYDLFRSAGSPAGQGDSCYGEAELHFSSDLAAANERYLAAYECYQSTETAAASKMIAVCAQRLGILARLRGEFDAANARFEEAARLHRESGSTENEAQTIFSLAETARHQRNWQKARDLYEQALSMFRQSGNRTGECNCLWGSGYNELGSGNRSAAYKLLKKGLFLSHESGFSLSEGNAHVGLGMISRAGFDFEEARREFAAALDLFTRAESSLSIGSAHKNLATVAATRADFVMHIAAARAIWSAIGYQQGIKTLDRVRQPRRRNDAVRTLMRVLSRFMRAVDM